MGGKLFIRSVELWLIDIGFEHSVSQVIEDEASRNTLEELEASYVALKPRTFIHPHHRPDEYVPAKTSTMMKAQSL